MLHDLRAEDHTGTTLTSLNDRVNSLVWTPETGANCALTANATPNGTKKAFTFAGASAFMRAGDVGHMNTGNDAILVDASSIFNNAAGYFPSNIAGVAGNWATAGSTMPQWWRVRLATAKVVTSYIVTSGQGARAPKDWKFQGTNDPAGATGWVDLDSRTAQPSQGAVTFTIASPAAYLWYRFYCTAINGGDLLYLTRLDLTGIDMVGTPRTEVEHWAVLKATASGSGHPLGWSVASSDQRYPFSDGRVYTTWGTTSRYDWDPVTPVLNNWRILRLRREAVNIKSYVDGVLRQNGAGVVGWTRRPIFGKTTGAFTGQIAHSFMVSRNLTDPEAAALHSELQAMYF